MSRPSRAVVVAANWKMHAPEPRAWLDAFERGSRHAASGRTILVFPPFPILHAAAAAIADRAGIELGAQNCHWESQGAFTGEVSPAMVRDAGARWVLVGHSERRHLFGETDETCRKKLRAALEHGLKPVLCVGETLAEREAGRARAVVLSQLSRAAAGLDREGYGRLVVAYEPVWAIGTGRTASPEDAQEMHAAVRDALGGIATGELAAKIPILYGGSVKPDNARDLMARPDVDGALVGGASLDPAAFARVAVA